MLCSLPLARLRVILLPREAGTLPFLEDVFDQIFTEGGVDFCSLSFVWPWLGGDVLWT